MSNTSWQKLAQDLMNRYCAVSEFHVGGAEGIILRVPSGSEAREIPRSLLSHSWEKGVCCKHLYQPEIEKAMDLNYKTTGLRSWSPKESWLALFKNVSRNQIFPIIEHLCDEFTTDEVALIEDLFSDVEWCTPLLASCKGLEMAVSDSFENEVDLDKWYLLYRDVSHQLFGNSHTKSDLKRSLSKARSVFFINMR